MSKLSYKERKELEKLATEITGIEVIKDKEYQRLFYIKDQNQITRQQRSNFFKSKRKVL